MFTPESYLKNQWNRLDFIVIVGTILNYLGANAGFVRLLRCLRPLRIINRNGGMRVIISAVVDSLAVNVGVLALSGLGLLIFGILGVSLFAGKMCLATARTYIPKESLRQRQFLATTVAGLTSRLAWPRQTPLAPELLPTL